MCHVYSSSNTNQLNFEYSMTSHTYIISPLPLSDATRTLALSLSSAWSLHKNRPLRARPPPPPHPLAPYVPAHADDGSPRSSSTSTSTTLLVAVAAEVADATVARHELARASVHRDRDGRGICSPIRHPHLPRSPCSSHPTSPAQVTHSARPTSDESLCPVLRAPGRLSSFATASAPLLCLSS